MKYDFDDAKFRQYFHYGLHYKKDEILDVIIMKSIKEVNAQKIDRRSMNQLEYEIDIIESTYLQFRRFIELMAEDAQVWYNKIKKENVSEEIHQRIKQLEKDNMLKIVVYKPMWGLYITDKDPYYNGDIGLRRYHSLPDWIKNDVFPMLRYLQQLEVANSYQYTSLFMDTKYARNEHANKQEENNKIKTLYTRFMEMVKPSKEDVYQLLGDKITKLQKNSITQNCADYWTLTDLKEHATTEKYRTKVHHCCETIRNLENNEKEQ